VTRDPPADEHTKAAHTKAAATAAAPAPTTGCELTSGHEHAAATRAPAATPSRGPRAAQYPRIAPVKAETVGPTVPSLRPASRASSGKTPALMVARREGASRRRRLGGQRRSLTGSTVSAAALPAGREEVGSVGDLNRPLATREITRRPEGQSSRGEESNKARARVRAFCLPGQSARCGCGVPLSPTHEIREPARKLAFARISGTNGKLVN